MTNVTPSMPIIEPEVSIFTPAGLVPGARGVLREVGVRDPGQYAIFSPWPLELGGGVAFAVHVVAGDKTEYWVKPEVAVVYRPVADSLESSLCVVELERSTRIADVFGMPTLGAQSDAVIDRGLEAAGGRWDVFLAEAKPHQDFSLFALAAAVRTPPLAASSAASVPPPDSVSVPKFQQMYAAAFSQGSIWSRILLRE